MSLSVMEENLISACIAHKGITKQHHYIAYIDYQPAWLYGNLRIQLE